ncbi:MAG: glycosyltransferase family 4 protein [Alphaproteobacteria bacterium]|jgi:glycosyltransferase involved in cell wall biosynthesis|nr:glycosyltransferase family 4 protein [Alphaproteobacteria bacterium]
MTITVLQIIPALGTGGAEQACVDVAVGLVERGDRAIILSTGGWRVEKVEERGSRHYVCPVATKNPLKIIKNAFWLAGLIRDEHIDVVHARSRAPAWSARIACRLTGCPFVTTFHADYKFSNRFKKAYNRVMASANRVIAISPYIAQKIKDDYGVPEERIRLINRGLDLTYYNKQRITDAKRDKWVKQWEIALDRPVIVFPARLSPIKGHMLILQALGILKKAGMDMPLMLFVGDNQGREAYSLKLSEKIEAENLDGDVVMVGACSDMPAVYSMATLVVQPSQVPEGFGRVPVEAMAMEVPVLASAIGAMVHTVEEGVTGWLVNPFDVDAWATALHKAMVMEPAARAKIGKAGRAHVAKHYGKNEMVQKTLAVYDELVTHG